MLTAFEIDGQRFQAIRIHKLQRPEAKSHPVLSAVWQTECIVCEIAFTFERRTRGFVPAYGAVRRCEICRKTKPGPIGSKKLAEFSPEVGRSIANLPRVWVHDGPDPGDNSRKKTGRTHVTQAASGLSMARTEQKSPPKAKAPPPAGHFRD
jgi:hypothetical protein